MAFSLWLHVVKTCLLFELSDNSSSNTLTFDESRGCISTTLAKRGVREKARVFNEMEGYTMTEAQKNEAVKMLQAGRSYKEIGEQIGVTPGSVKQFFYRRRKQPVAYICE